MKKNANEMQRLVYIVLAIKQEGLGGVLSANFKWRTILSPRIYDLRGETESSQQI